MEIITAERLDPANLTACLDEEVLASTPAPCSRSVSPLYFITFSVALLMAQITFLEFLEVLFGCAEVFLQVSEGPDELPPSSPDTELRGEPPKAESDEDTVQATTTQQVSSHGPLSTAQSYNRFHMVVVTADVDDVASGFIFSIRLYLLYIFVITGRDCK